LNKFIRDAVLMSNKKYWLVVCLVLLVILGWSSSIGRASNDLKQGKELFFKARDQFYNRRAPQQEIVQRIEKSKDYFLQLEESAEKYCWLARANFLYSDVDKAQAKKWIRAWQESAEQAVQLDEQSGAAHALLGSAHLLLVEHVNHIQKVFHSRKGFNLLQQAIELDSSSYLAYHSLGIYYLMAPRIAGGNVDKSISYLKRGIKSKDRYIRCLGNFYLAYAYEEKGNLEQSLERVKKALSVYPNNPNIKRYRNLLKKKLIANR